jgi:drug/metabolite transporter (DMT)-like permease
MTAILSPRTGVVLLAVIATTFGANHIAARVAFDHGVSVATAVVARSGCTALALLALLLAGGVRLALPRTTIWRALAVGALIATQSYCMYSAVAGMPVALALVAFNLFPILLALLAWALDGIRPSIRGGASMLLALMGLALALDVFRWAVPPAGLGWALGAAISFAAALYLTGRWLKDVDGRVRSFYAMSATAVLVGVPAAASGALAGPVDMTGWIAIGLLSALYGTAITAMFVVVPRLPAPHYSMVLNIEPIVVLVVAWQVLGQAVAPIQVAGALTVVGAIVLLVSDKR